MATPITHTALTEKIFNKLFKNKIRKDFFIGTLFPDIRYLKVINRKKTHYSNLIVSDLKNDESFLAGIKFHSILDQVREEFIAKNNVYSLCPKSKYITQSLKILEDELFYKNIKDPNVYVNYLNEILPAEKEYNITEKDLKKWHSLLQKYFQKQPNQNTVTDFILNVNFTREIANEINKNISTMRTDKKIIKIIENLYNNFDLLIIKDKVKIIK